MIPSTGNIAGSFLAGFSNNSFVTITIVQGAFFPVPAVLGGAVEKIWYALGREFVARGHRVTHISRSYPNLPDQETIDGVLHIRVPGFSAPSSLVWLKLLDLIYSCRVLRHLPAADILVTNTFWLPMLVRNTKRGSLYVHIQRYPRGQIPFYAHAARLQTVSQAIATAVKHQAPHLSDKVVVIPNPVPEIVVAEDSIDTKEKTILFVGRIHPEKGLEILLRAFAIVRRSVPEATAWRLQLVGPWQTSQGGAGDRYLSSLRKLGEDGVEWSGPVFNPEDLRHLYRKAAIFVYPSIAGLGEASPVAPIEAMSAGCATIVSALDCFSDYLHHDVNGLVFQHNSIDPEKALGEALRTLIVDATTRRRIGENAKSAVSALLPGIVAERYLADFTSLLSYPRNTALATKCIFNASRTTKGSPKVT